MMARLRSWWRRNVIDTDPCPEYSRLDRMDGWRNPTPRRECPYCLEDLAQARRDGLR